MQRFPDHWDTLTRINYLQRKILLLSISYYMFDFSPVSDHAYDEMAHQLADLMQRRMTRDETALRNQLPGKATGVSCGV